jgi:hypothetical protein
MKLENRPSKVLAHSNGTGLILKIMSLEKPFHNEELLSPIEPFVSIEEDNSLIYSFTQEK